MENINAEACFYAFIYSLFKRAVDDARTLRASLPQSLIHRYTLVTCCAPKHRETSTVATYWHMYSTTTYPSHGHDAYIQFSPNFVPNARDADNPMWAGPGTSDLAPSSSLDPQRPDPAERHVSIAEPAISSTFETVYIDDQVGEEELLRHYVLEEASFSELEGVGQVATDSRDQTKVRPHQYTPPNNLTQAGSSQAGAKDRHC